MAGSEQALQRAKELALRHLEQVKEDYLRWQQRGPQGPRRTHSETDAGWGRRTPGRSKLQSSQSMVDRRQSSTATLADFIVEAPTRNRTK